MDKYALLQNHNLRGVGDNDEVFRFLPELKIEELKC